MERRDKTKAENDAPMPLDEYIAAQDQRIQAVVFQTLVIQGGLPEEKTQELLDQSLQSGSEKWNQNLLPEISAALDSIMLSRKNTPYVYEPAIPAADPNNPTISLAEYLRRRTTFIRTQAYAVLAGDGIASEEQIHDLLKTGFKQGNEMWERNLPPAMLTAIKNTKIPIRRQSPPPNAV